MDVEIQNLKSGKSLALFKNRNESTTILEIKKLFESERPKFYANRQSLKDSKDGKALANTMIISDLKKSDDRLILYFKDLGPQVSWTVVFLSEYAGPLIIYLIFHCKRNWFYSKIDYDYKAVQNWAVLCWCGHYFKRLMETIFVHRFSHETMPIMNLFKNCSYYWGFTAFVAYFNNHHLYTPAVYGDKQILFGLGMFILGELGNFSIHIAFMNMRPKGSTVRKIPYPTSNPFTWLFNFVSCPNYTYEGLSWLGFSIMTQSLPALLFTIVGFGQMSLWALGKHRAYRKEFSNYPRSRKAIIPFIL